ncbi:RDD family protein [Streptomyces sp. NRRL S-1448]|uniref:RDD family protein n=1 Tax=Streptomyces sp. NRRL S-1448 TaxID=1463883 RepID=UPI00099D5400|nr:RDD family protein [Streptomyces sp. NRRL S-1448]
MNATQAAGPSSVPPPHMPPPEHPGAGPAPTRRPSLAARTVGNQGLRLLAVAIDMLTMAVILALPSAGIAIFRGLVNISSQAPFGLVLVVALAMSFLYSPLMTSLFGGTVGKLTCGVRVVRLTDGRRLSYGQALGRHLAHSVMGMVPVLGHVDALFCLWDRPFRQCLHDKTVGSVVIRSRIRPPQAPRL